MSNVAKHGVNRCTKQRGAGDKRMATRKARTDGEQDDGWPKRLDHAGALERIMQRSDGSLKGLDQDTARRKRGEGCAADVRAIPEAAARALADT